MRIVLVMVGRTIPGFNELADRVGRAFKAEASIEFIDFPLTRSFRKSRNQYDADAFLSEMARFSPEGELTVFIIREDMFSEPLNFVFGLAKKGSCVVSTARLDPRFYGEPGDPAAARALFKERIFKEVLHEIGHLLGLPHCEDRKCTMVFSDSIKGVDFKDPAFCGRCRVALRMQ